MGIAKPNSYDQTQALGDFVPLDLGGHDLVIKEVKDMTNKNGQPMIKVSFDTADNDKQPHYFADQFRNDIRPEKKWPNNGTTYININDQNGVCSRNFKTFCTSVEKSNAGFSIQWGDGFCACFKNKHVGGIFGIEKGFYNGKDTNQHKLRWFRSVDKALNAEIPEPVETADYKAAHNVGGVAASPAGSDGFMNIPDTGDDELPFA